MATNTLSQIDCELRLRRAHSLCWDYLTGAPLALSDDIIQVFDGAFIDSSTSINDVRKVVQEKVDALETEQRGIENEIFSLESRIDDLNLEANEIEDEIIKMTRGIGGASW